MKRTCKLLVFSIICLLGVCVNGYAATPKVYKMPGLHPNTNKSTYSTSWKKVDLNGDRKLDKITVKYSGGSSGYWSNFKLTVNDKASISLKNDDYGFSNTDVHVCQLKNGQVYMYIRDDGYDNCSSFCRFYRYDGKKLILAYNVKKMYGNSGADAVVQKVSGNTITIRCKSFFNATSIYLKADYKLRPTANKKLDRSSRTGVVPKTISGKYNTLRTAVKSFKTATSKDTYKTLAAGSKVRLTHIYCTSKFKRLRLVTSKGAVVWIRLSSQSVVAGRKTPLFKGMDYR